MPNQDYTSLASELEKNEQICISLKSLIDSDCSKQTLSVLAEELCDKSETIKYLFGVHNQ
ncbi:hypothetical protein [Colwellia sp. E2M01]|uniref:hypothetical protein n=1 Tax=Colwellia sp. E2M01 TaxID=2841561 RepID=UPI001C084EA5|nr:hypothetical protein [Colwellia sp. E2M01]MBU2871372.1 hypothetical protein [Colwellia sp. E2M01]